MKLNVFNNKSTPANTSYISNDFSYYYKTLPRINSGMFYTSMTRHAFTIGHQSALYKLIIAHAPDVCQSYSQQIDIYVVLWAACPFTILWPRHSCCHHPLTRHKVRKCLTYIPLEKLPSDRKITLSDGDGFNRLIAGYFHGWFGRAKWWRVFI